MLLGFFICRVLKHRFTELGKVVIEAWIVDTDFLQGFESLFTLLFLLDAFGRDGVSTIRVFGEWVYDFLLGCLMRGGRLGQLLESVRFAGTTRRYVVEQRLDVLVRFLDRGNQTIGSHGLFIGCHCIPHSCCGAVLLTALLFFLRCVAANPAAWSRRERERTATRRKVHSFG
jgi:hypothetical protein